MRVAIIGAGLAGLRAAALLEERGATVEVFEASDRLGGRLWTARPHPGIAYEAGGEWIDHDHLRIQRLLEDMGHPARPAPMPDGWVDLEGERVSRSALWADARDAETVLAATASDLCRDLRATGWEGPQAAAANHQSLAAFLDRLSISRRGRAWLDVVLRSDEGHDLDQVGLLGWLLGFEKYVDREGGEASALALPMPGECLVAALAAQIRGPIQRRTALRLVECDGRGALWLTFETGPQCFDRMVCTVPPTALGALRLPGLSEHKQRAICGYGASLVLKVALAFERPWWEAHPSGGRTWSDGLLQQTWAPVQAEGPVLIAYVCGWRAAHLRTDPVRMAHTELVQRFPEAQAGCLGGWAHDWQATPFVGIAHEHLRTGLGPRHLTEAARPVGSMHFAGTWTAGWHGFLEGALESAERVVDEIIEAEELRHAGTRTADSSRVL
jgi:monoamine oxidase